MKKQIAIATSTYYCGGMEVRYHLALQALEQYRQLGYPVFLVDDTVGDLGGTVRDKFRRLGATIFSTEVGGGVMGQDRRTAIRMAVESGADLIVWAEPEKLLAHFIAGILRQSEADLIIVGRQSLESYPSHQRLCEETGNREAAVYTGRRDLDLWFGPRIFTTEAARFFLDYNGEYGDVWDSIFIPAVRAIADRTLRVESVTVPYTYPLEQAQQEEGDHAFITRRNYQLKVLHDAIREECTKLGLYTEPS